MNNSTILFFPDIGDFRNGCGLKISSALLILLMLPSIAAYGENKTKSSLIFSGGMHVGGITQTEPLDAVSSASKKCGHGGVHTEMDIAGHPFEIGLEYSYFEKRLDYKDAEKGIDGRRSFTAHGLALPVLYNFHFFNRANGDPNLVLGVGLSGYYFPQQDIEDTGTVSVSDAKNWAAGPCIRITYFPFTIKEKYFPGLYLHLFRSINQFYSVDYEDADAGELAILGFGLSLKLKP